MIASKDFVYCPTCRYEICLTKCEIMDIETEHCTPKFAPLSNDIVGYTKKTTRMKKYLCPNDKTVLKEEEIE